MCFGGGHTRGPIDRAACLTARGHKDDFEVETFAVQAVTRPVSHALNTANNGKGSSEDGTGRGVPIVVVKYHLTGCKWPIDYAPITAAFAQNSRGELRFEGGHGQLVGALSSGGGIPGQGMPMVASVPLARTHEHNNADASPTAAAHFQCRPITCTDAHGLDSWQQWHVRRLMPLECERLQGLPDNYTLVPYRGSPAPDGPRYKAIGNSMAVPCVRWIGQRLIRVLGRPEH